VDSVSILLISFTVWTLARKKGQKYWDFAFKNSSPVAPVAGVDAVGAGGGDAPSTPALDPNVSNDWSKALKDFWGILP
jgi:hypothetical protein